MINIKVLIISQIILIHYQQRYWYVPTGVQLTSLTTVSRLGVVDNVGDRQINLQNIKLESKLLNVNCIMLVMFTCYIMPMEFEENIISICCCHGVMGNTTLKAAVENSCHFSRGFKLYYKNALPIKKKTKYNYIKLFVCVFVV